MRRSRGISSPSGTKITSLETRVLAVTHSEDFHDPRLRRFDTIQQCDRRTDRQTDRRKDALALPWQRRA